MRERIRRLPLRTRLTLAGTLLLPIALGIAFGLVYLRFESALTHTIDDDLRGRAESLAAMTARHGPRALGSVAAQELLRPRGAFAQVVDRSGRRLSGTAAVARIDLLTPEQAARAAHTPLVTERGRIPALAKRSRLLAVPVPGRGWAVVVGRSLSEREAANESFARALLIGGPLALLIAAAAIYVASAAALRPVESMRRRAAEITGTELSARLPVPDTGDEIARLGHTLNAMIARLEDTLARQRELTQNASHELRTPLTVLTAEIELASQHSLPPPADEAMATALDEARRVSRTADDLLALAHLEEGELPLARETVDLDDIVRSAVARAARSPAAASRKIDVCSEPVLTAADPLRMEQAVANLIDNALTHGRGTITVTVQERPDSVRISVEDEGPGFESDLRETAFDRFTRGVGRPRKGAGLGLAIVRAIARAHGGDAEISEGSACVVINLPR